MRNRYLAGVALWEIQTEKYRTLAAHIYVHLTNTFLKTRGGLLSNVDPAIDSKKQSFFAPETRGMLWKPGGCDVMQG